MDLKFILLLIIFCLSLLNTISLFFQIKKAKQTKKNIEKALNIRDASSEEMNMLKQYKSEHK